MILVVFLKTFLDIKISFPKTKMIPTRQERLFGDNHAISRIFKK